MYDSEELAAALRRFTGTEGHYKHWLKRMTYTDGVKFFAENAGGGSHWFLDVVATEIMPLQDEEAFISIELTVKGEQAVVTATDGNDNQLYTRVIGYTDCPDGAWHFYLINNIMLLRSEY